MEMKPRTPEFDKLAFTVLAIEVSAEKLGVTATEMRRRLEYRIDERPHPGLLRHFAYRKPESRGRRCRRGIVKP